MLGGYTDGNLEDIVILASYVDSGPKVQWVFRASALHRACRSALKTPLQFIRNMGFMFD